MKPPVTILYDNGTWFIYPPLKPRAVGSDANEGGLSGAFRKGIELRLFSHSEKVRVESGDWLSQDMDFDEGIEFAAIKGI